VTTVLAAARALAQARDVRARLLLLGAALVSGCGGNVVVDQNPNADGASCGNNGLPLPTSLKACQSNGDCTIRFLPLDDCGTPAVVGVATLESAVFASYAKRCDPFTGGGNCDPGPAVTDEGQMVMGDVATVAVACAGGLCQTSVP
jgi:hypothetical protein